VLTDVGPVEASVPRDRDASFEPRMVANRQRRLTRVDEMVISPYQKGAQRPSRRRLAWRLVHLMTFGRVLPGPRGLAGVRRAIDE